MSDEICEKQPNSSKQTGWAHGLQLCLVQCSVCVLAVLLSLCLKYMGGTVYGDCVALFRALMTENHVLTSNVSAVHAPIPTSESTVTKSIPTQSVKAVAAAVQEPPETSPPLSEGVLTSTYGPRTDPFDEQRTSFHYGVDIAAEEGTPLLSLRDGVVTEIGEEDGYGKYVKVRCDARHEFLYAHCSDISVTVDDTVSAGECIAFVGNTGRSTGSHVHVEWQENGNAIDPAAIVPLELYD